MFRIGLLLLLFAGSAEANVVPMSPAMPLDLAPLAFPLVLPITGKVVIRECFDKDSFKAEAFPEGDVVEFSAEFIREMTKAGFRGAVVGECTFDDDPAGGIITHIVFSTIPKSSGKGLRRVVYVLLKVPAERRWVPVEEMVESDQGPVSKIRGMAKRVAGSLIKAIRKAQSGAGAVQPKPTP